MSSSDSEEEEVVVKRRPGAGGGDGGEESASEASASVAGGGQGAAAGGGGGSDSDSGSGSGSDDDSSSDDSGSDSDESDAAPVRGRKRRAGAGGRKAAGGRAAKKRRGGAARFLDQEAAVGGDDEDEEEEAAESGDELTEREAEKLRQENLYKPRTQTNFEAMLQRDSDHHIEERYRAMARASAHRTQDFYEAGGAGPRQSEVTKQSLLPTPGVDACMWRVKVKKNLEQAMVMAVMDMARKLAAKRQRVGITAAVFAGTKGHVLIEARNEADATEAVRANARFVLSQRLEVVEYRYMPHSLAVSEKIAPKPLRTGQWCRFKRGLYKGDLARVIAILEGGSKVVIEMVPRINYEDMARPNTRAGNIYIVSSAARPSQKFFSAAEAREQGVPLHRMKHPGLNLPCDVACNLHYLNGYLVKEVKPEALQTEGVNATVEEVTKFGLGALGEEEADGRGHEERLEAAQRQVEETQEAQRQTLRVFEPGDTVRVTKGEAAGLVGRVLGSDPTRGTVAVRPLQAGLPGMPERLDVQAHELCNHVAVGQHVKVLDGMFAGETGMVQALLEDGAAGGGNEEPVVSILTDGENKEIRVRLGQVKESAEVASALSSLQGYALHDMVCFGYQRFGVVIWLGRESVKVLDSSGVVQTLPVGELQGNFNRRSRQSVAYDSTNSRIQVDDQVTVTDRGEHFQKRGTIKHVLNGTLWVHTKQEPRNAGIFVTRASAVALQNLMRRTAVQFNQLSTSAAGAAGPGGMGGAPMAAGMGGRGFGARANMDPLVGKFVRIRGKSEFKGQGGKVRSVKDNVVFVDLETGTRPKTVRVDRAAVFEEPPGARAGAGAGRGADAYGLGAATPAWMGGRTPMHGGQTPMHGGATPMHGGATPMHQGGATPSLYGGQTPSLYGQGSYTPRHQYNE